MPKYQLISPYDNRVYTLDDQKQAETLANMGYKNASDQEVRHEDILRSFDGWQGRTIAAASGFLQGIPGASTVLTSVGNAVQGSAATAADMANIQLAQEANPSLTQGAQLAGMAGTGMVAAGASAALGVGEAAFSVGAAVGGETGGMLAQAAAAGAENVALGQAYRIDNAAIEHALTGAGQEKLVGSLSDYALDFATGFVPTAAISQIGKAFRTYGKQFDMVAQGQYRQALVDQEGLANAVRQGRESDIWQAAESVGATGKSAKQARPIIDGQLKSVEQQMNAVKAQLGDFGMAPMARQQAAGKLESILAGTPLEGKVAKWYDVGPAKTVATDAAETVAEAAGTRVQKQLSIGELQSIRREIYDSVDWSDMSSPQNLAYKAAGAEVGEHIKGILAQADVTPGASNAQNWAALDKQYSNLQLLKDNLRSTKPATSDWMGNMLGWSLAAGASGIPGVGQGVAMLKAASKFAEMYNEGRFGTLAKGLGKVFSASGAKMADVVEAGLYGVSHAATAMRNADNYQTRAAAVAAVRQNPTQAYTQLHSALTQGGVPTEVADGLADRVFAIQQWLGQQLPGRIGASDLVTRSQPDPSAQLKWLDKYHTATDPQYGLANPTQSNLNVLKQFYPEMLVEVQQAVLQQIQGNPDLPAEARVWASRVLGRPVTPLATNAYITVLASARAEDKQTGSDTKPGVQSSGAGLTRLQQLQSKAD